MSIKVFLDSSILIEVFKGNDDALTLLSRLKEYQYVASSIVFNEVVYILRFKKKINLREIKEFFDNIEILEENESVINKAFEYVEKYNLKPGDALVLAICSIHDIKYLATLDTDFLEPAKKEGIKILMRDEDLEDLF